jgi:type I restriction enzyme S subunit
LADFIYIGRFKRTYEKQGGVPFIGGREMLFWPLRADKHLSAKMEILPKLYVKPNWVLVTCSGTIGQVVMTGRDYAGVAVSQHVMRVIPKEDPGYVYAFLRSSYGQDLISSNQFGAVINEVTPKHLEPLPVPMIPEEERKRIDRLMKRAVSLRVRGALLLAKADKLFHRLLGLPLPQELQADYMTAPEARTRAKAFVVRANELGGRLDASHHVPEVRVVKESLLATGLTEKGLAEMADVHIPARFKRVYTDVAHGTPFLQGSHVPMVRPTDIKYLSNGAHRKEISTHRVNEGQVLVTCSGTLGRVALATESIDGWTASQHIARISAGPDLHPGFLHSFLASVYGQCQLLSQTYGAVIDELTESQIGTIRVLRPPTEVQCAIGDRVTKAYALRDQANALEETAIAYLEHLINAAGGS